MNNDDEKIYIVVDKEYRDTFEDEVSKRLQEGYLPLGGVSNYIDGYDNVHFCQALLKPAQKD